MSFAAEEGRQFWCSKMPSGRPGASILVPWAAILAPWGHPGRPREQQERRLGVQNRILSDLRMILGPHCCKAFRAPRFAFVFGFVAISLLTPVFESKSGHSGILNLFPHGGYCDNHLFAEAVFLVYDCGGKNLMFFTRLGQF